MAVDDGDRAIFDAFLLGIRTVCQAQGIRVAGADEHLHWDLLREIAEGRATLVTSPAEKALKYPDMTEAMKEYLARNTNPLIAKDRDLARRVLRAMADM